MLITTWPAPVEYLDIHQPLEARHQHLSSSPGLLVYPLDVDIVPVSPVDIVVVHRQAERVAQVRHQSLQRGFKFIDQSRTQWIF